MLPNECEGSNRDPLLHYIIDEYSCYGHVYLISHKSNTLKCFNSWLDEVVTKMERSMKMLNIDYVREYIFDQLEELCTQKKII